MDEKLYNEVLRELADVPEEQGELESAAFRLLWCSWLAIIVALGLAISLVGCGSSSEDTVTETGTQVASAPAATTGGLVFRFTQAQTTVPSATAILEFNFYDGLNNLVLVTQEAYSAVVTVSDVPLDAVRVEIKASDSVGLPVATISDTVEVSPGETTDVQIADVAVTPVLLTSITAIPPSLDFIDLQSQTLSISSTFSDGSTVTNIASTAFMSADQQVVTVSQSGEVASVSGGATSVTVAQTVNDVTQTVEIPVTANVLELEVGGEPEIVFFGDGFGETFSPLMVAFKSESGQCLEISTDSTGATFTLEPAIPGASIVSFGPGNFVSLQGATSVSPGDVVTVRVDYQNLATGVTHLARQEFVVVEADF